MSSQNTTNPSSNPPEEKSQNQVLKEGGYNNFQEFMRRHNLRMHNDDDVQLAKEILSRSKEYDRAGANDGPSEKDKPRETNQTYHSGSFCGVRVDSREGVEDEEDYSDENGHPVEGAYDNFEWGVDEPEFEGYPAFSDDEEGYDFDQGGYDDEPDNGDGDYEDYGDDGDDGDDGDYGEDW